MNTTPPHGETSQRRTIIPWPLKLAYTAFTAVLTVYYWREYGPTNFLYFCDIALFLAVLAVWTEKPIYASMAAVGITIPQLLWQIDFLGAFAGVRVIGMTEYMFDDSISLIARGLSFFHFWLPILLLYLVWRLGYDRRALIGWTIIAWGAMLIAYFALPGPGDLLAFPNQPHNVNYVFGPAPETAQTWMPGWAWLSCLMLGLPALFYLPTHAALAYWDKQTRRVDVTPESGNRMPSAI
ncbi:hypothetical protein [Rosistilla oblonga]|uniref:hypothetical protein n=1 Tax=Rosistilla oblonga TaxID=2527990 RepID=UPI003A970DA0